ncbi:Gfo/Idh/MocA family oxidoreductase [Alteromonadaceae bacterium BrNp21-10]|nr:Gfo/Idh/MocA family oxidoreductase [Alteromonadaceae bacterium BrNp21-10]
MQIKWGIIGPGRIAQTFTDALLNGTDGQLVAVASSNLERAQSFAKKNNVAKVASSYQALANDPNIDVIYIAATHNFHFEHAIMCLQAGKHLLIEKPITINAQQAQEIVDLATSKQCFVMEALWTRFLPSCQQAKQWLDAGEIGELQSVQSSIGFAFDRGPEHRAVNKALAGGALLDLGVYSVAMSQWFLQDNPVELQSMAHIGDTDIDSQLLVNMRYSNQRFAQFTTAVDTKCGNHMILHGSKGDIEIANMFWAGETVQLNIGDKSIRKTLPKQVNGFEYQIREVHQCLQQGKRQSDVMPLADTLANMHTMDSIRQQIGLHYGDEMENSHY